MPVLLCFLQHDQPTVSQRVYAAYGLHRTEPEPVMPIKGQVRVCRPVTSGMSIAVAAHPWSPGDYLFLWISGSNVCLQTFLSESQPV